MKIGRLKSSRRFGLKTKLLAATIIIVALLVYYFVRQMNSPSYGTIAVQRTDTPAISDSTNYSTLSNNYFDLLYPSDLTPDFPPQKRDALVYNYLARKDAAQTVTSSLEIYVKTLSHGGVAVDSDYKFYQGQPKAYKLSQKFIRSEPIDIAVGGNDERAALWAHGNYLLVLKLKAPKDNVDVQLDTILKSVQWLKG